MSTTEDQLPDPATIREQIAAVHPATADQFDGDYARADAEARATGDNSELARTLRMWSGVATRLTTGEPPAGSLTAEECLQRLGLSKD